MTVNSNRHRRGEDGTSLILALAFLTLFSVFAVSTLSLAGVGFKNTTVTRSRANLLYSADGGVEWGVRKLATEPSSFCKDQSTSFTTIPAAPAVNGLAPTVQCKTTAVDTTTTTTTSSTITPIMNGWAMVIRTGGMTVNGNPNGAPTTVLQGNVYSRPSITASAGSKVQVEGNLRVGSGACPPANVTRTGTCTVSSTIPLPVPNPPKVVVPVSSTSAPPARPYGSNCTILYPGRYTAGPSFLPGRAYYLASGTYYFVNTGDVNVRGTIFGGAPGSDTQQLTGPGLTPCATDAIAQTEAGGPSVYNAGAAGTGVTIVLGGNAGLRMQNDAQVELFTRVPKTTSPASPDSAATPRVGIWARTTKSGATGGYTASSNAVPFRTQEKASTVVIHGTTYLPEREVNIREVLNPAAPGTSMFMGGLIANRLVMDLQGNGSPTDIARLAGGGTVTTTVSVPKTTVLQSTADNTVVTAIIDRPSSAITSWRRG